MAIYNFKVKNTGSYDVKIEAENREEAIKLFNKYGNRKGFMNEFRKNAIIKNEFNVDLKQITRNRKAKTMVEKFYDWHKNLLPGTEYTNEDIEKAIGAKTPRAKYNIKQQPLVRDILLKDQITWRTVGVSAAGAKIVYRKGKVAA